MHEKNFSEWSNLKRSIHGRDRIFRFREREIWWCALGINIGVEIDGKNEAFERPVLIIKRINKDSALVIPLTRKEGPASPPLSINGRRSFVKISQLRTVSSKRLLRKIESVTPEQFALVQKIIVQFIS